MCIRDSICHVLVSDRGHRLERTGLEGPDVARALRRPRRRHHEYVPVTIAFRRAQRTVGRNHVCDTIAIQILVGALDPGRAAEHTIAVRPRAGPDLDRWLRYRTGRRGPRLALT